MKLHTLSREHKEEYYFQSDYLFDASAIKLKNINSMKVEFIKGRKIHPFNHTIVI